MCLKPLILVGFILILYNISEVNSKFELTNIKCNSLDEQFCGFEYCFIKSVNRTYKYFSLKVNLHKVPIRKIKINFGLYKRFNGYKPFLYNITFDACKYLLARNPNPVVSFFYDLVIPYSNMNHSCPFDHDVIVDKLSIGAINFYFQKVLPFPEGDYSLYSVWYADGDPKASVNIYGTLS